MLKMDDKMRHLRCDTRRAEEAPSTFGWTRTGCVVQGEFPRVCDISAPLKHKGDVSQMKGNHMQRLGAGSS